MPSDEPTAGPHRAKRSLGQNFLVDPNLQRKIVDALRARPGDEVLEIGPGRGALTHLLAARFDRLTAVELDDMLARQLQEHYADAPSVRVLHRDILDLDLREISADPARLRVVGNIPYNITTPILFHLLEQRPRPAEILLMVQREVAERILAEPGGRAFGALAVGVRTVATAEHVLPVGRNAFRPVPRVDSSVIRIVPHSPPPLSSEAEADLRRLTRAAFGQRRKQFQRILRDAYDLAPEQLAHLTQLTGFDLRDRPESFSPDQFVTLSAALRSLPSAPS